MAITQAQIKQDLRELKAEKAKIEARIESLEGYLQTYLSTPASVSVRGGVDIRPTIKEILEKGGNEPMKMKILVETIAKELSMEKQIVEKKMQYAKRDLENTGYGMYRLKIGV